MNKNTNQYPRLTKAGAVTLVFTLIFSVLFIVLGIVNLTGDESSGGDTYKVYANSSRHISVDEYEYYDLEFKPNYSGTYTINLDGAYISYIENDYGNRVSYNSKSSSSYDYSYSAYLYSSYTYTIRIYAVRPSVTFYAY